MSMETPSPFRFERAALYEEVWSTPMTSLAKKYGLSDNGLRKVCKALSIPLPAVGHWAKIGAGHRIERPPLPAAADRTEFVSTPQGTAPVSSADADDQRWLKEQAVFEAAPENRIQVEIPPQRWHRLIGPTRDALRERVRKMEASRKLAESPRRMLASGPRLEFDSPSPYLWTSFNERGQLLETRRGCLPMRVTLRTWERALAIMNALLFAAERRGMVPTLSEKGALTFRIRECTVGVRMSERLKDVPNSTKPEDRLSRLFHRDTVKSPTGVLRIYISGGSSEVAVEEGESRPFEGRLNDVVVGLCRAALREASSQRRHAAWRREREEEDERARIAEARRQEGARKHEQEAARRKALIEEAHRWHDATLLRAYIAHIERQSAGDPTRGTALSEWLDWARRMADEMDPSAERVIKRP